MIVDVLISCGNTFLGEKISQMSLTRTSQMSLTHKITKNLLKSLIEYSLAISFECQNENMHIPFGSLLEVQVQVARNIIIIIFLLVLANVPSYSELPNYK